MNFQSFTKEIERITQQEGGKWGVVIEDVHAKKKWTLHDEESFPAASIIKIPIMIAAFRKAEEGKISLSDTLLLKREDIVGGSGVLQYMTPGISLPIYDFITLMIIQSDNTATNMLLDILGMEYVQETMREIGMLQSKCYNKLMVVPVNRNGENTITAAEIAHILKKLLHGEIISHHASEQMILIMKKQQIRESLPGKFPSIIQEKVGSIPSFEIAHKTGNISGVRHDVGIFYMTERQMVVSLLSKNVDDLTSKKAFHEIGALIYQYLKEQVIHSIPTKK